MKTLKIKHGKLPDFYHKLHTTFQRLRSRQFSLLLSLLLLLAFKKISLTASFCSQFEKHGKQTNSFSLWRSVEMYNVRHEVKMFKQMECW